jgi:hypothetical protein
VDRSSESFTMRTRFGVESTGLEVENPKRIPSANACGPLREAIELGLSRGRDATAIWQDLVSESGFGGGYQTVKRYVRKLRGNQRSSDEHHKSYSTQYAYDIYLKSG